MMKLVIKPAQYGSSRQGYWVELETRDEKGSFPSPTPYVGAIARIIAFTADELVMEVSEIVVPPEEDWDYVA